MPRPIPPPLSLALTHLRTARGWTQQDLAAATGLTSQRICDLEMGTRRTLSRERLERLSGPRDCGREDVTLALVFAGGLAPPRQERPPSPLDPPPSDLRRARRIAARVGMTETSRMYAQLLVLGRLRRREQARREAGRQWEVLRERPPAAQLKPLVGSPALGLGRPPGDTFSSTRNSRSSRPASSRRRWWYSRRRRRSSRPAATRTSAGASA